MIEWKLVNARTATPPEAPAAPAAPGAAPGAASWGGICRFDRAWHASEARLTSGLSPAAFWLACADWALHLADSPAQRAELRHLAWVQAHRFGQAVLGGHVVDPAPGDRRFQSELWQQAPYHALYQGFLLTEAWWKAATGFGTGVSAHHQKMVAFAARQWLDMLAPTNFPWTNPDVLRATAETGGRNFLLGLKNYLDDWHDAISDVPAARGPYEVGRTLAVSPGKVVLRNALIELIQYAPTTATVAREPVLIVPAWIMKYYILDLSPHNSLIKFLVDRGHTVFAISWKNPGADLRDMGLDDYRRLGPMAALDAIGKICGGARVHGCGYCLGGTLLAMAAAAMGRDGDDRLASLTLLAAQTDFTEAGELQLFIGEGQVSFLEDVMDVRGTLDSRQMAGAFQMLRSNDLVWSRLIRSYMLGETENPSDLMTWNADGTRMPARMHGEYLRHLFLDDDLAEGRFDIDGAPVSLGDIRLPCFLVGTETDHIAPWRSVFKLHLLSPADMVFVLTSGGHNAGIVSEPGHTGRFYRMGRRRPGGAYVGPDAWREAHAPVAGSWWPEWAAWLAEGSGERGAPPPMGARVAGLAPLCDAPGTYVREH